MGERRGGKDIGKEITRARLHIKRRGLRRGRVAWKNRFRDSAIEICRGKERQVQKEMIRVDQAMWFWRGGRGRNLSGGEGETKENVVRLKGFEILSGGGSIMVREVYKMTRGMLEKWTEGHRNLVRGVLLRLLLEGRAGTLLGGFGAQMWGEAGRNS